MTRIAPESKKQALIADLLDARSQLLTAASTVPPDRADVPFLGAWSLHDIVAHLIGWDHTNLQAIAEVRSGCLPQFYSAYDSDWHTYNAVLVQRHKQPTLAETLACVVASHSDLVAALEALPAADLTCDYGVRSAGRRRVTVAMLVQAETSDERKHAEQIRTFVRRLVEN
jgi:hypothetical protein